MISLKSCEAIYKAGKTKFLANSCTNHYSHAGRTALLAASVDTCATVPSSQLYETLMKICIPSIIAAFVGATAAPGYCTCSSICMKPYGKSSVFTTQIEAGATYDDKFLQEVHITVSNLHWKR